MRFHAGAFGLVLAAAACRRAPEGDGSERAREAPHEAVRADVATVAPGADASHAGAEASTAATSAQSFTGTAEGRGAEPPIHEFAPRAGADAWHGTGATQLQIDADGTVRGTITMSGLALAVRGRRVGDRVVATIEQVVGADSPAITIEGVGDAGPPEGVFRGALDADVSGGNTIRGTWEASAGAGVHRRRGTLEAHAP